MNTIFDIIDLYDYDEVKCNCVCKCATKNINKKVKSITRISRVLDKCYRCNLLLHVEKPQGIYFHNSICYSCCIELSDIIKNKNK